MALPFPFDAAFVVGHAATADERGDGSHTSSPLLISGDASVRLWTPEDFARLAVRADGPVLTRRSEAIAGSARLRPSSPSWSALLS